MKLLPLLLAVMITACSVEPSSKLNAYLIRNEHPSQVLYVSSPDGVYHLEPGGCSPEICEPIVVGYWESGLPNVRLEGLGSSGLIQVTIADGAIVWKTK